MGRYEGLEPGLSFAFEMKETEEAKGRGKEPEKSQVNLADLRHCLKQWTCGFDAEKCNEKIPRDWMKWKWNQDLKMGIKKECHRQGQGFLLRRSHLCLVLIRGC